nr:unnamed protein product [Digitaria exilis]
MIWAPSDVFIVPYGPPDAFWVRTFVFTRDRILASRSLPMSSLIGSCKLNKSAFGWTHLRHPSTVASWQTYKFDFLILCIGKYGTPNIPTFPLNEGPEVFNGKVLHTMEYSRMHQADAAKLIQDKRVVVVGSGKSAFDTVTYFADTNEAWYKMRIPMKRHGMVPSYSFSRSIMACRLGILPDGFYDRVDRGKIVLKPCKSFRFCEDGVLLVDGGGCERVDADVVILATGYQADRHLSGLFFSPWFSKIVARQCIHPRIPQMAVIGYTESTANIHAYEMMAKWVAHLLDGEVCLPGVAEMEHSVAEWDRWGRRSTRARGSSVYSRKSMPISTWPSSAPRASGLAACKHAQARGFRPVVFEAGDGVGGVWRHTLATTRLQTSAQAYRFSDFPWPEEVAGGEEFPRHDQVVGYLAAYARRFGVLDCLRLGAKVLAVEYVGVAEEEVAAWERWSGNGEAFGDGRCGSARTAAGRGGAAVARACERSRKRRRGSEECDGPCGRCTARTRAAGNVQDGGDYVGAGTGDRGERMSNPGAERTYKFDFLILCIGRYGTPNIPTFPLSEGPEVFNGKVLHTMEYSRMHQADSAKLIQGKRVVVVGSGKSAFDTVTFCADTNGCKDPCTMIYRSTHWMVDPAPVWGVKLGSLCGTRFAELTVHKPGEGFLLSLLAAMLIPLRWLVSKLVEAWYKMRIPMKKHGMVPKYSFSRSMIACRLGILPGGFYDRVDRGKIALKACKSFRFCEDGLLLDGGGCERVDADVVILATGYQADVHLSGLFVSPCSGRQCVHPRIPQMAVIGYPESPATIQTYEMMAKWVAHLLDGEVCLPSVVEMERSVAEWDERKKGALLAEWLQPYGSADYADIQ